MMKRKNYLSFSLALSLTIASLLSCSKEECRVENGLTNSTKATINLSVELTEKRNNLTKSQGANHLIQSDDNIVNNLSIFIFRDDAQKTLETYKYQLITDQVQLGSISIESMTGIKHIYVIANSHGTDWSTVKQESQLLNMCSFLRDENLRNFTMSGQALSQNIGLTNNLSINLKRLVSKVVLNSISTDFAGTPYEGDDLSDISVYLTNVRSTVMFSGYEDPVPTIANPLMNVPSTYSLFAIPGAIYDNIVGTIGSSAYQTKHIFYAYSNQNSIESPGEKFTRLVIEATLNGTKYYYPININRGDFGNNNGSGIVRNTIYSISVIIKRPGSNNPETLLEKGVITSSITVSDWDTQSIGDIEF